MTSRLAAPLLIALLTACGSPRATVLLTPDPDAEANAGERGPYGAAALTCRTQARVSETVRFDAIIPADADGELATSGAPYPAVLQIQGGLVTPERYRWQAVHLASRGFVVLVPRHSLNLAILASDNGSWALDEALERSETPGDPLEGAISAGGPVSAMGHSLGGVVASMRWVDDERVDAVAVFASYAAGGTDVESMDGHPSLLLTGSEDQVPPEEFFPEWARYPEPTWQGVVDGMNHYDWTDDAKAGELKGDGEPTRPQEDTRRDALRVLDTWHSAVLLGDADAAVHLAEDDFPGIEEVSR